MGKLTELKQLKKAYLRLMFPQEGECVPKIRFTGFTEPWVLRKLGEVINRVSIQSNADNLPKVEFEDIISGEGLLNKDVSNKFDKRKGILFEPGNILYGKLRPYLKNWLLVDFNGIALGDFWVFESNNTSSDFNFYLIQTEKYQEAANLSTGTKMPRSDWNVVSETNFLIPNENKEQTAIGNFFRTLDDMIALQKRKLNSLKQLKKAYLRLMFPQEGECVPKIRFDGFTEPWELRKLREVAKHTIGGGTPITNNDEFWNGDIPWIQSSDLNEHNVLEINIRKYITAKGLRNSAAKLIPKNSLAIVTRVGVGKLALIPFEYTTSQDFISLCDFDIDAQFGIYLLYNLLQKDLNQVQGTSIKGVTKHDLLNKIINIPSQHIEQRAIGNFFRTLDDMIALNC